MSSDEIDEQEVTEPPEDETLSSHETPPAAALIIDEDEEQPERPAAAAGLERWRTRSWRRRLLGETPPEQIADKLAKKLHLASEALLDRLFSYLSRLPEPPEFDDLPVLEKADDTPTGITLPASAIGWIASQLYPEEESFVGDYSFVDEQADVSTSVLSVSVRDRLSLLKFLLPRLTYLRITAEEWPVLKQKVKLKEGTDDPPQDMESEERCSFLEYFDGLIHRPRVDMRIFPNCQVLLIDQVPPEWISHLDAVRHSLQVLRVERSCIFDMHALLALQQQQQQQQQQKQEQQDENDESSSDDPLQAPPSTGSDDNLLFTKLTHLKLSHCGLSESSGLRGRGGIPPPFSRMISLKSLSLAHNELASERSALAGLSNKPFLSKLDLSYNQIVNLKHVHYRLGNIQTLLLSHNHLKSVQGIDRLFSLETLGLDHNQITDLAKISGLARLPELRSLRLKGNPFVAKRKKAYRVSVLDLFRERRLATLPENATFRQLQRALPLLDDKLATIGELKALRERTFAPPDRRRTPPRAVETVDVAAAMNDQDETSAGEAPTSAPEMIQERTSAQAKRRRRMRHARIGAFDDEERIVAVNGLSADNDHTPTVTFSVRDVLLSLSQQITCDDEEEVMPGEESAHDEVPASPVVTETTDQSVTEEALTNTIEADHLKVSPFDEAISPTTDSRSEETPAVVAAEEPPAIVAAEESPLDVSLTTTATGETPIDKAKAAKPTEDATVDEVSNANATDTEEGSTDELLSAPNDASRIEKALNLSSVSPIKHEEDGQEMKASAATTATTAETNIEQQSEPVTPTMSNLHSEPLKIHVEGKSDQGVVKESPTIPDFPRPPVEEPGTPSSMPSSVPTPAHLNMRVVSFPGNLWQDDNQSITSSIGTPHRDEASTGQNKFSLAEEFSTYEGPNVYRLVRVLENLELYFRLFVFNMSVSESARASSPPQVGLGIEDDEWQTVLEQYPKIQLWPIDRRMRDAGRAEPTALAVKLDTKEEFRRVWRENIVACGKPALRRLTPNRGARFGFHGELLWSAANTSHLKPETVAECRNTIVCLSDTAFYIILDHDTVTVKAKDRKRKFPLPIPECALFQEAKWPHALARHPFHTLQGITIGFGFQRLTLRFSNPTFPSPDDFTYILLTANKIETIALLKELQELANEARAAAGVPPTAAEDAIKIENDDRHVLDALGVAVAPDVIGVVFHYQILQQQWKHGERGAVRRVCVVTDTKLFLLDEDYVGDGSESIEAGSRTLGETMYRLVDSADLKQISEVKAADADPNSITIAIQPLSRLQRKHNWRLLCRDRHGAERLVEDVRKAMSLVE